MNIPTLLQINDRFDIICILRETEANEQADREYISKINQNRISSETGIFDKYEENIRKYLMYARTFNPTGKISEDALSMINEYWINMGQRGIRGRNRKLESLKRIAVSISKLKLKHEVDIEDAKETMELYNVNLMHFQQITPLSQEPKEVTYQTCIEILKEHSFPIELQELIKIAGERKEQIKLHIGQVLNIEHNWKLRTIKDELLNNKNVILIDSKPIILKWKSERDNEQTILKADSQASDVSDVSDVSEGG